MRSNLPWSNCLPFLPVPGTGTASVLTGLLRVGPCRALEVKVQEASLMEREAKYINSTYDRNACKTNQCLSHWHWSIGLDLTLPPSRSVPPAPPLTSHPRSRWDQRPLKLHKRSIGSGVGLSGTIYDITNP